MGIYIVLKKLNKSFAYIIFLDSNTNTRRAFFIHVTFKYNTAKLLFLHQCNH